LQYGVLRASRTLKLRFKSSVWGMAIYRLLQNSAFDPEMIQRMTEAYEDACRILKLTDRKTDPITELVARKIIKIAQTGVRDPQEMRRLALDELGIPAP
jgi:hypothetical protein